MYNLLIADDESIECRALEHKIHDMFPQISLLPCVYDGLSLLKTVQNKHPDIAIVDINMPGINGLEAIELLRMHDIDLKIIINTSYSDFNYIQKALQLGASDYLLKPGSRQALKAALIKVMKLIDQEKSSLEEKQAGKQLIGDLKHVAEEKWLLSLLLGNQDMKCLQLLKDNNPSLTNGGYFTAWKKRKNDDESPVSAMEINDWKLQLINQLAEYTHLFSVIYNDILYCFHFAGPFDNISEKQMSHMLNHVCEKFYRQNKRIVVGCSRKKENQEQFMSGVLEAKSAMEANRTNSAALFQYKPDMPAVKHFVFEHVSDKLIILLTEHKITEIDIYLDSILDSAEISSMTTENLKIQIASFLSELHWSLSGLKSNDLVPFIVPIDWSAYRCCSTFSDISAFLKSSIHLLINAFFMHHPMNPYVDKAIIYMYENYTSDMSLESTADTLGLSPFYLSRLIRPETNVNFVDLLTDIRIRTAIRLMHETDMSGNEMANAVGYTSAAYFYRVFKKSTGITYGEMKKQIIY